MIRLFVELRVERDTPRLVSSSSRLRCTSSCCFRWSSSSARSSSWFCCWISSASPRGRSRGDLLLEPPDGLKRHGGHAARAGASRASPRCPPARCGSRIYRAAARAADADAHAGRRLVAPGQHVLEVRNATAAVAHVDHEPLRARFDVDREIDRAAAGVSECVSDNLRHSCRNSRLFGSVEAEEGGDVRRALPADDDVLLVGKREGKQVPHGLSCVSEAGPRNCQSTQRAARVYRSPSVRRISTLGLPFALTDLGLICLRAGRAGRVPRIVQ